MLGGLKSLQRKMSTCLSRFLIFVFLRTLGRHDSGVQKALGNFWQSAYPQPHYPHLESGNIWTHEARIRFKGMIFVNIMKVSAHHSPFHMSIRDTNATAVYLL